MATLEQAPIEETESAIVEMLDSEDDYYDGSAEESAAAFADWAKTREDEFDEYQDITGDENEAGDEDQSFDDDPTDEETEEPVFTVKVRGEERQVNLHELQNGYSRTEDYKAKTAEVAEMRRAVDAEKNAYAQKLDAVLQTALQIDPVLAEGRQTNWAALAAANPQAYSAKKAAFDQRISQLSHMAQERDQINMTQMQASAEREEQALMTVKPEWADPEVGAAAMAALRDNLVARYGFSRDEVQNIPNHKFALVAEDARK